MIRGVEILLYFLGKIALFYKASCFMLYFHKNKAIKVALFL